MELGIAAFAPAELLRPKFLSRRVLEAEPLPEGPVLPPVVDVEEDL